MLNCTGDISSEFDDGSTTGTVTLPYISATDDSGETPSVACTPASGGNFNVGTNTVTCNATDSSDNTGMCTFLVNVTGMCLTIAWKESFW